jgi:hypothetical protein
MKENIKNKIDQIKLQATTPKKGNLKSNIKSLGVNDSLSKSIRNSMEATVFLTELDAAIKMAQAINSQ